MFTDSGVQRCFLSPYGDVHDSIMSVVCLHRLETTNDIQFPNGQIALFVAEVANG